jgi:hypothetical protein
MWSRLPVNPSLAARETASTVAWSTGVVIGWQFSPQGQHGRDRRDLEISDQIDVGRTAPDDTLTALGLRACALVETGSTHRSFRAAAMDTWRVAVA